MKTFKLFLIFIITVLILFWTFKTVEFQNSSWRSHNGNVGLKYWFIVPLIWLKVTSYGLHLIRQLYKPQVNKIGEFKLISISQRIGSNIIDFVCISFIWFIVIAVGALILLPFYKMKWISPQFVQDYGYTDCFNYLFDIGWYIFGIVFFIYTVSLEYFKQSTFGKMINNCGIISTKLSTPNIFSILIKNLLRLIPINEICIYIKGYSLNEEISKTRLIFLEDHNQELYNKINR